MSKDKKHIEDFSEEKEIKKPIKKYFREIYSADFDDPCEEFTDAMYDLIPEYLIGNELRKIKGIKIKHGKVYYVEKKKTK